MVRIFYLDMKFLEKIIKKKCVYNHLCTTFIAHISFGLLLLKMTNVFSCCRVVIKYKPRRNLEPSFQVLPMWKNRRLHPLKKL
jgi:hypothetical protein